MRAFATIDESLDVTYAETQPLATESILLDVVRHGNRFVAVGERGHVIYSDDGETWTQADVVPTRSTLTTVFSNNDRLWAAGHDTVIITSGDGGKSWSLQFFDPERQQAVMDIHFVNAQSGVAMGSYGLYLLTDDGGKTWEDSVVDTENDFHLNHVVRFDDGRQMIAGEAGYSYRSYDDGESWEPLDLPYLGSMWGALITEDDCVLFFGLRGHVMESCDFGDNWQELDTGIEASLSDAVHVDGETMFAGNSGQLLQYSDSKFDSVIHDSGVDFASILSLGNGQFLLVGEDGVHRFPESSTESEAP